MVQLSTSGFQMTSYSSDVRLSDHGSHLVFWSSDNRIGYQMIVQLKLITKLDCFIYKKIFNKTVQLNTSSFQMTGYNSDVRFLVVFKFGFKLKSTIQLQE
jgi:hypothetical protein